MRSQLVVAGRMVDRTGLRQGWGRNFAEMSGFCAGLVRKDWLFDWEFVLIFFFDDLLKMYWIERIDIDEIVDFFFKCLDMS